MARGEQRARGRIKDVERATSTAGGVVWSANDDPIVRSRERPAVELAGVDGRTQCPGDDITICGRRGEDKASEENGADAP